MTICLGLLLYCVFSTQFANNKKFIQEITQKSDYSMTCFKINFLRLFCSHMQIYESFYWPVWFDSKWLFINVKYTIKSIQYDFSLCKMVWHILFFLFVCSRSVLVWPQLFTRNETNYTTNMMYCIAIELKYIWNVKQNN